MHAQGGLGGHGAELSIHLDGFPLPGGPLGIARLFFCLGRRSCSQFAASLDSAQWKAYIRISEYEIHGQTPPNRVDLSGTVRPDPLADSQSAAGRRTVRLRHRGRPGRAATNRLSPSGLPSTSGTGGRSARGSVDALPSDARRQWLPPQTPRMPCPLLRRTEIRTGQPAAQVGMLHAMPGVVFL